MSKKIKKDEPGKEKISTKDKLKVFFSYLLCIALGIFVALILREIIPRYTYKVSGTSMYPTYQDGEKIKVTPCKKDAVFNRYDVIVAKYKFPNSHIIKRIVAFPGETVFIDTQGRLFVDGNEMTEEYDYANGNIYFSGLANTPIHLGEDEYFLIGDNTNVSLDSRSIGPIKRNKIIAIVNN